LIRGWPFASAKGRERGSMSGILARVQELVQNGEYVISGHGREELAADDISTDPAVLVTAYRPDDALWTDDFKRRRE
jgi:hypothetical protein